MEDSVVQHEAIKKRTTLTTTNHNYQTEAGHELSSAEMGREGLLTSTLNSSLGDGDKD